MRRISPGVRPDGSGPRGAKPGWAFAVGVVAARGRAGMDVLFKSLLRPRRRDSVPFWVGMPPVPAGARPARDGAGRDEGGAGRGPAPLGGSVRPA